MFPAKAILFGEYTVVLGHKALAVPVPRFGGAWKIEGTEKARARQFRLVDLAKSEAARSVGIDQKAMETALGEGLFFDSNIPTGYGLGSSGAVTAAVFERFSSEKRPDDLADLQQKLGALESFFHGKSSGLDPLVSFLNQPVLVEKGKAEALDDFGFRMSDVGLFLLDTRLPRSAKPIIEWFLEKTRADFSFRKRLETDLAPANSAAIGAFLNDEKAELFDAFSAISAFQMRFFEPMLPNSLADLVASSLSSDDHRLKICGAGGGGFLLGITRDLEKTRADLSNWPLFDLGF